MKTIQVTIDEPLLHKVDDTIVTLDTTRSAFIRKALQETLKQHRIQQMEQKHAEGYHEKPVEPEEFDIWVDEQDWEQA